MTKSRNKFDAAFKDRKGGGQYPAMDKRGRPYALADSRGIFTALTLIFRG